MHSLERLFDDFGIAAGSAEALRLRSYLALLQKWGARMDLVAAADWPSLEPLFAEALWAARRYPAAFLRHLDIGSGGGFPAVPMKILLPQLQLTLVESRNKRAVFLEAAAAELGLTATEVFNGRLRAYLDGAPASWDCVSWKAIRLKGADLLALTARAGPGTQFWVFHGSAPPLPDGLSPATLLEKVAIPNRSSSFLSVYGKI